MALTEKMLEKAKQQMVTNRRKGPIDREVYVRAYLEHGTFGAAAAALKCSVQEVHYHVKKALKDAEV